MLNTPVPHVSSVDMHTNSLRTIVFHPPSPLDAGMFEAPAGDLGHAPWIYARNEFEKMGVRIVTSYRYEGALEEVDWIVFMAMPAIAVDRHNFKQLLRAILRRNTPEKDFYKRCITAGLSARLAVMLWEPAVVSPENYLTTAHKKFARIFTWSEGLLSRGEPYSPIVWPQPPIVAHPESVDFSVRKLLCNFSGNKTSTVSGELYTLRVAAIRYMEAKHPGDFDHYGPGWDKTFPSWKGVASNKFDVYPNYRFGLCFENMKDEPGYITEKIFDCLRSGCVPVYFGAPDIAERIPAAAFIDYRDYPSLGAMLDALQHVDEARWQSMRKAGQDFLSSPAFDRFQRQSFFCMLRDGFLK